jgi:hypothetical protein
MRRPVVEPQSRRQISGRDVPGQARFAMDHPARFQVRVCVQGELDPAWSTVFGDLSVVPGGDGTTVVCGELADQAAVQGVIAAVRDLGMTLLSLETVAVHGPPPLPASGPPRTSPSALADDNAVRYPSTSRPSEEHR